MRNATRRKQDIWFVSRERDDSNINPSYTYGNPVKKRFSVSSTSGTPLEMSFGILPVYNKYIISYDRKFKPVEGTYLYVDRVPEINTDGTLKLLENGEPTVKPDYILTRIMSTQKGFINRYGIDKCTGDD